MEFTHEVSELALTRVPWRISVSGEVLIPTSCPRGVY